MLRDMFKKTYTLIDTKYKNHSKNEPNIPEGLWRKCKKCGQPVYGEDVKNNNYIPGARLPSDRSGGRSRNL